MNRGSWIVAAAAVLMFAGGALAQGVAVDVAEGPGVKVEVLGGPEVKVAVGQSSEYWIGVALAGPVQESDDEPGLKVVNVIPDGPAAKAGIEPGDRLVKAGKAAIKEIGDLTSAIDAAEGKPLTIEVAREGKVVKLEVTPGKRASAPRPFHVPPLGGDVEALKKWVENMQKGQLDENGPFQFRVFGPGAIVPGVGIGQPQPDDMTITITKKGDTPAQVTVKQGDQTWKTTVDELGELPDEVRPHVARLLGRGFGGAWGRVRVLEGPKVEVQPGQPRLITPQDPVRRHHDEQIEQLNKKLDEMNKRIEELQQKQVKPGKKPDKV